MKTRSYTTFLAAAIFTTAALGLARAEETTSTIKFSDPAKPGTLKISLGRGELQIQGSDTPEIAVRSEAKAITSKPRKDGLRVISAASSFALSEKDNVVTLDAANGDWGRGNGDFKITVPRNTNILVQNAWGGDFAASNIAGDIEINSMHGDIRLDDVSGGIVVGTMNGEIRASIRELHDGKPVSFTSMNGEVILRVPETAKANVRLRTQNGSVMTDFDDTALVTKTESTPYTKGTKAFTLRNGRGLSIEVQDAIREATQVSAVAVRQALESVKEGLESAKLNADDARRQLDEARKQLDRYERDNKDATAPVPPVPPTAPVAAAAPKPPVRLSMPTISGGKLVTGTLNGGGPEIGVSTMNGDVVLRKLDAKK